MWTRAQRGSGRQIGRTVIDLEIGVRSRALATLVDSDMREPAMRCWEVRGRR
jgi:hypothetical protein